MTTPHDLATLKSRQQAAWASGDYAVIGTTLQLVGEQLAEACDGQQALERDLVALLAEANIGGPDALTVPSAYLQVVATRA